MSQETRRYLIVGPSWIGDMVMAQSLFITLKKLYPDCMIDVIAPRWSLPILKRMPEVSDGIAVDVSHGEFSFFKRRQLGYRAEAEKVYACYRHPSFLEIRADPVLRQHPGKDRIHR
jgi:heptosyltransferase-2